MAMRLKGKVAIVTGGSRGIGRAACLGLAGEGARVVVNYVSRADKAAEVVRRIAAAGGEAFAFQADVSNAADVERMTEAACHAFGGVDILVNNAGADPRSPWDQITEDEWDRLMAVNLKSQFLCARSVVPCMKKRGKGKIINVTSIMFFVGATGLLHYTATKGGIIGLTRALARELGPDNINVNAIAPGAIQTESELEEYPDQAALAAMLAEKQCLPRRITPEDMVGTFVFLASDDSDPITGQTLLVDAGWALH
jgi:3-oxoacyl-[acyl-carrier protein] reductase